jgi:hypothetical protein
MIVGRGALRISTVELLSEFVDPLRSPPNWTDLSAVARSLVLEGHYQVPLVAAQGSAHAREPSGQRADSDPAAAAWRGFADREADTRRDSAAGHRPDGSGFHGGASARRGIAPRCPRDRSSPGADGAAAGGPGSTTRIRRNVRAQSRHRHRHNRRTGRPCSVRRCPPLPALESPCRTGSMAGGCHPDRNGLGQVAGSERVPEPGRPAGVGMRRAVGGSR